MEGALNLCYFLVLSSSLSQFPGICEPQDREELKGARSVCHTQYLDILLFI